MIRTIIALRSADAVFPPKIWNTSPASQPHQAVFNRIAHLRAGKVDADCIVDALWSDESAACTGIADIAPDIKVDFAVEVKTCTFTVGGNPTNGPIPADAHKVMFAYHLPEGTEPDRFWHYHTEIHGPDVVKAGGDLIVGYALSRKMKTLAGSAAFFALIELWWVSEIAAAAYAERSSTYITQSGKAPLDDWASRGPITDFSLKLVEAVP